MEGSPAVTSTTAAARRSTSRRLGVRAIAFLGMAAAMTLAAAPLATPAAQATSNGSWGIRPQPLEDTRPRALFELDVAPGDVVRDAVTVTNETERPLTLGLAAVDATTLEAGGGFALGAPEDKPADVGAWVTLEQDRVDLEPGSSETVPFVLRIPDDATPGDHAGGIVSVESVKPSGEPITIRRAVGVRIFLRVDGPLRPALTIESIAISSLGAVGPTREIVVDYRLRNAGNVRLRTTPVTSVAAWPRGDNTAQASTEVELLPGSVVAFRQTISGGPALGHVRATVEAWASVPETLDQPNAGEAGTTASASSTSWILGPWAVGALVGALVVILVPAVTVAYRRRRREPSRPTAASGMVDHAEGAGPLS
jgi:hypothetical protein